MKSSILNETILVLLFSIGTYHLMAQSLIVERDTTLLPGLCTGIKETDACVTIIANKMLQLSFESSTDQAVHIASQEEVGENIRYSLTFPTDNIQYLDRILEVSSQLSPVPKEIPLNLKAKESRTYYVSFPECYKRYYREGLDLFKKGLYTDSQDKYRQAQQCHDLPLDADITQKIEAINTILYLKGLADESYQLLDYKEAMDTYQKILFYNYEDKLAIDRYVECKLASEAFCNKYYLKAQYYFNDGEYDKAKILYRKILNNGCIGTDSPNYITILYNLDVILKDSINKKQRSTALTYEWSKNTPIGFSIGGYKDKKVSGYFTVRINPYLFESLRSNYENAKKPEINISAGWTFRPVKNKYVPIWVFLGPGYTGVGEYIYNTDTTISKPKFEFYNAISPEMGILGKIGPVILRYTFQYRFALDAKKEDYIEPIKHILGVGICF